MNDKTVAQATSLRKENVFLTRMPLIDTEKIDLV